MVKRGVGTTPQYGSEGPIGALVLDLPWYVCGTLPFEDGLAIEAALAANPRLAAERDAIAAQRTAVKAYSDALGQPSERARRALFAAIDADLKPMLTNFSSRLERRRTFARQP